MGGILFNYSPGQSVPPTAKPKSRLSTGAIAGIAAGVVLVFILAGVAFFLHRRIRRRRVQFEKGAHSSMPSVQPLMGTNTPISSRYGHVTPWEGPSTPISGPLQTPQSAVPPIPNYPPPRIDEGASPSTSVSGRKTMMAFGNASPIAGSSRDGGAARQRVPTSAQSPISPGFSPSRYQNQQPGAFVYEMEHHKPPLDLGVPSTTPVTERGVEVVVTAPSSSGNGQNGSERGLLSAGGSRRAILGSETTQTVAMGAQEHPDRSATPPPAYEYRVQPGTSAGAQDQEEEERGRREERRRRRDEKTASGSGLALTND